MSTNATAVDNTKPKKYALLNAAYYHGNNIKTVLDIALRTVGLIGLVVGITKLALV